MRTERITWSPDDWVLSPIPLVDPHTPLVVTNRLVDDLVRYLKTVDARDTSAVSRILHPAHLIKSRQGNDGRWPAVFDARTGAAVGTRRTSAPARLLRKLDMLLDSTEFACAYDRESLR